MENRNSEVLIWFNDSSVSGQSTVRTTTVFPSSQKWVQSNREKASVWRHTRSCSVLINPEHTLWHIPCQVLESISGLEVLKTLCCAAPCSSIRVWGCFCHRSGFETREAAGMLAKGILSSHTSYRAGHSETAAEPGLSAENTDISG